MTVLFNQHWDIASGKQQAYSDFIMAYYNPALEKIGIKLVGGYHVTVGMGPRVLAVGLAQTPHELERALSSSAFEDLTDQLMEFVTHYHSKILVPTGRVKMDGYKVQTGLWKFNQYWNIVPSAEKPYSQFVVSDFIPTLEKLGLTVTAGWRVVVGSGPYILAEASAHRLVDIALAIDSDEFRRVSTKLKVDYVTDYHSRILRPTGRVDLPIFMSEMMASF